MTDSPTRPKQPGEARVIPFEFADKLGTGDSISASSVAGSITADAGITVAAPQQSGTLVLCKVSAGTDGQNYRISCKITTTLGEILELDVIIQVREGAN